MQSYCCALILVFFCTLFVSGSTQEKKVEKFIWRAKDNKIISCDETNKVLNENYNEIKTIIQNAFDDAVLIDCDEKDFKNKIIDLVNNIEFSLGRK